MEISYHQEQILHSVLNTLHCAPEPAHLEHWELQKEMVLQENTTNTFFIYDLAARQSVLFVPGDITGITGFQSLKEEIKRIRPDDLLTITREIPCAVNRFLALYPEQRHKGCIYLRVAIECCDGVCRVYFVTISVLQLTTNAMPWLIRVELQRLSEPYSPLHEPRLWCNADYKRNSPHSQIIAPIRLTEKRKNLLRLYSDGHKGLDLARVMGSNNNNQRNMRYNMLRLFSCHTIDTAVFMARKMKLI